MNVIAVNVLNARKRKKMKKVTQMILISNNNIFFTK